MKDDLSHGWGTLLLVGGALQAPCVPEHCGQGMMLIQINVCMRAKATINHGRHELVHQKDVEIPHHGDGVMEGMGLRVGSVHPLGMSPSWDKAHRKGCCMLHCSSVPLRGWDSKDWHESPALSPAPCPIDGDWSTEPMGRSESCAKLLEI